MMIASQQAQLKLSHIALGLTLICGVAIATTDESIKDQYEYMVVEGDWSSNARWAGTPYDARNNVGAIAQATIYDNINGNVVGSLTPGSKVQLSTDVLGDWIKVETSDGAGWVRASDVIID